jgi:hypothetical protein
MTPDPDALAQALALVQLVRELEQCDAELSMAAQFVNEAGTDPQAWIDGVRQRLRRMQSLLLARSGEPQGAMTPELQDALTLLKQLAAPCDGAPTDHGWRKCKRCTAVHGVQMRFKVSMRLIQRAIDALEDKQ